MLSLLRLYKLVTSDKHTTPAGAGPGEHPAVVRASSGSSIHNRNPGGCVATSDLAVVPAVPGASGLVDHTCLPQQSSPQAGAGSCHRKSIQPRGGLSH